MSYTNRVLAVQPGTPSLLQEISRHARKWWARFRWVLWKRCLPVPFSLKDAVTATLIEDPEEHWLLSGSAPPTQEEIGCFVDQCVMPWLNDVVLRAPNPMGIDFAAIAIWIWGADDEPTAEHRRLVDKYGWRKGGWAELRGWLMQTLHTQGVARIEVGARVFNPGRLIAFCNLKR